MFPEWFVELSIHYLKKTSVDIREDVFFGPFDAECVPIFGIRGMKCLALDVVAPPAIIGGVGTKMKGAADDVITALAKGVIVATRFHDVNLARSWPLAIFTLSWKHPDGWPQPITAR